MHILTLSQLSIMVFREWPTISLPCKFGWLSALTFFYKVVSVYSHWVTRPQSQSSTLAIVFFHPCCLCEFIKVLLQPLYVYLTSMQKKQLKQRWRWLVGKVRKCLIFLLPTLVVWSSQQVVRFLSVGQKAKKMYQVLREKLVFQFLSGYRSKKLMVVHTQKQLVVTLFLFGFRRVLIVATTFDLV